MFFVLLLILLSASNSLIILPSSCTTEGCKYHLTNYVEGLKPEISCDQVDHNIVCTFPHSLPNPSLSIEEISGLSARLYTIADNIATHQNPFVLFYKSYQSNELKLHLSFIGRHIKEAGCQKLGSDSDHLTYQCLFSLEYRNEPLAQQIKTHEYRITINFPWISNELLITANHVLEDDCDCDIIPTLGYTTKIYKDEVCSVLLPSEAMVTVGDWICLEVVGTDPFTSYAKFTITSVTVEYSTNEGEKRKTEMVDVTRTDFCKELPCGVGKSYAIFPVFFVGRLKFTIVVTLSETRLLLSGRELTEGKKGMRANFIDEILSSDPNGLSTKDFGKDGINFGVTVGVSLMSLLTFLLAIF